jgi:hypothetical protein
MRFFAERRYVEGRCTLPLARLCENRSGELFISNSRDIAPNETSAAWWSALLDDPRLMSPKLAAAGERTLADLNAGRMLILSCRPCEWAKSFAVQELLAAQDATCRLDNLAARLRFCPQGNVGRQCHGRWRQE